MLTLPVYAIDHPTLGEISQVHAPDADSAVRAAKAAYWFLPAGTLTARPVSLPALDANQEPLGFRPRRRARTRRAA